MLVNVATVINTIRENLNDRYRRGFPVVKELIQNADDSGAICFDFGLSSGLPQARHPLLQGPALFIINDGSFGDNDAIAINSIALSSKPANQSAIGKFGLGLKSVFHFCEAFFYTHSQTKGLSLVNPWALGGQDGKEFDRIHPDWNDLTDADAALVLNHLNQVLPLEQYFCLWIPLRRKSHLAKNAAITDYYPGDNGQSGTGLFASEEHFEEDLSYHCASLLPLLGNLRRIQHWGLNDDRPAQPTFTVVLQDNSTRRRLFEQLEPGQRQNLLGVVAITNAGRNDSQRLAYVGSEMNRAAPLFDELQRSDFWPKYTVADLETFAPRTEVDKAKPHCAVYFALQPQDAVQPSVQITKSVFLPVGEPETLELANSTNDVLLTLHGYFFVDAGRSRIEGLETVRDAKQINDARSLREAWNDQLFQLGTLPLVLPALEKFVQQVKLSEPEVTALTKALSGSHLYRSRTFRTALCKEHQWIYCVALDERQWRLLPADRDVLAIPEPPANERNRPFTVLPKLADFRYLTFNDYPRLIDRCLKPWAEDDLLKVLELDVASVFASTTKLQYLVNFLEANCAKNEQSPPINVRLLQIGRQAMVIHGPTALRNNRKLFAQFCGWLPARKRLTIKITDKQDTPFELLLHHLATVPCAHLLIPTYLDDESNQATGVLALEDAQQLLIALTNCCPANDLERFEDARASIALQIMRSSTELEILRKGSADLQLFSGTEFGPHQHSQIRLSLQQLQRLRTSHALFKFSNPPAPYGLAKELAAALCEIYITLVRADILTDLGLSTIGACDVSGCINTLVTRPQLSAIKVRTPLLAKLIAEAPLDAAETIAALRYLIHAAPQHYGSTDALQVAGEAENLWALLLRKALAIRRQEQWRLVPPEVTEWLSPAVRKNLGIQTLGQSGVIMILDAFTDEELCAIDMLDITDLDRNQLLNGIDNARVLRMLPLHITNTGERTALVTARTYIASDYPLPETLTDDLIVLRAEPHLQSRYVDFLRIPLLDPAAVLGIALTKERPVRYWREIMAALAIYRGQLGHELQQLKNSRWLPLANGNDAAAPQDVIFISGMEEEIARLLGSVGALFVDVLRLDPELRAHSAWGKLSTRLFPSPEDAVEILGIALEVEPRFRVGKIQITADADNLAEFLDLWAEDSTHILMPIVPILRQLSASVSAAAASKLWVALCKTISLERATDILTYLSRRHEKSPAKAKEELLTWFNCYLESISSDPSFEQSVLPKLRLLNGRGEWCSTARLGHGYVGIDRGALLNDSQAYLLRLSQTSQTAVSSDQVAWPGSRINIPAKVSAHDLQAQVKRLHEYFAPWEAFIDSEVIGGFLALLGDFPDMRQLAERYLGRRHLRETRELLDWTPLHGESAGAQVSGAGQDIHRVMTYQAFLLEIVDSYQKSQSIISLTGKSFDAHLLSEDDITNLIVQDGRRTSSEIRGEWQVNQFRLRQIDVSHFPPQRLIDLLGETARFILSRLYSQKPENFKDFWQDMQASEQLDIESAQDWILRSAPHYLPQLGLRSDPALGPLIKLWSDAEQREIEIKHSQRMRTISKTAPSPWNIQEQLQGQLRRILESSDEANLNIQARMVAAMQRKIQDVYQYRVESVLFELLQNADDAVAELGPADPSDPTLTDLRQSVIAELRQDALLFAHWGRAINQSTIGTFDGADLGYDHDLPKMLIMQTSDKSSNPQAALLTGKFGLGFKSVYLISERPQVLSGRLAFEIVGGIFPRRMVNQRHCLEEIRSEFTAKRQRRATGTVFYLPATAGSAQTPAAEKAFLAFRDLAHVAVVFAQQIRQCELRLPGKPAFTTSWRPQNIASCPNLVIGELRPANGTSASFTTALVLRDETTSLLLTLGARGFEKLSKSTPTIWVTAPTLETHALGFALNTKFDLDVGRAQLARDSANNQRLAQAAGHMLANALTQLVDLTRNWQHCCTTLNLAVNTTPYEFWDSLWSVLVESLASESDAHAIRLLRTMVMGPECGMGHLIEHERVIPTRLPGNHRHLSSLNQIRYAASGVLQQDDILVTISAWPQFRQRAANGQLVHHDIRRVISNLIDPPPKIETLSLMQLIQWETAWSSRIEPQIAERLGTLIDPDFMPKLHKYPAEEEELRKLLRTLEFRNRNGNFLPARDLLLAHQADFRDTDELDEQLRSRFAPDGVQISPDYGPQALAFFRACRERLLAPVETLAKWAFEAADEERKKAVLTYCLKGDLGRPLADHLRQSPRFGYSWLQQLDLYHPLLSGFALSERPYLLSMLGLQWLVETAEIVVPLPQLLVGPTLQKIYEWWAKESPKYIRDYENQTYPGGAPPTREQLEYLDQENWRHAWLTLFVLGASHTIGRTQPEAHRNFLQLCQTKGWFSTFADKDATADAWMNVLDQYLDDEQIGAQDLQYWHLFGKQFVSVYQLSHFLPDYLNAFLHLDRAKNHVELHNILNPRTSERFQGSGLDAPPITRTLGLGACFVIRELARLGVLKSPLVYPHCFVPMQRVRNRFIELGCPLDEAPSIEQSSQIYRFLREHLGEEQVTFGNTFDIPFQVIYHEWGRIPSHLCVYKRGK